MAALDKVRVLTGFGYGKAVQKDDGDQRDVKYGRKGAAKELYHPLNSVTQGQRQTPVRRETVTRVHFGDQAAEKV